MAEFFDATVKKPMLAYVPAWIKPNHLTILRAALVVPVVIFKNLPTLAVGLLILSSAFDILDGPLARARGIADKTGAILDPVADKVFILGALWFACGERVHLAFRIAITALEILLTGIRPLKERRGLPMNSKAVGAIKTWAQSFAIAFVLTTNQTLALAAPFVFGIATAAGIGSFSLHLRDLVRHRAD